MRQILLNSGGAVVARVPRPIVQTGSVLVRVRYSLISVGTEIAPLRTIASSAPDSSSIERGIEYAGLARHYLRASIRDPRKAMDRVAKIARSRLARLRPAPVTRVTPAVAVGGLTWTQVSPSASLTTDGRGMTLVTDETAAGYQIVSQVIPVPADHVPVVRVQGRVESGVIAVGLLNEGGAAWIGSRNYEAGPFEDTLIFDAHGSREVTVVVTTAGAPGRSRGSFSTGYAGTAPRTICGFPPEGPRTQGG